MDLEVSMSRIYGVSEDHKGKVNLGAHLWYLSTLGVHRKNLTFKGPQSKKLIKVKHFYKPIEQILVYHMRWRITIWRHFSSSTNDGIRTN